MSCGGKKEEPKQQQQAQPVPKSDTSLPYYDVSGTILSEITNINNEETFIYKITEQQGKKDSVAINKNQFSKLAAPFYEIQLTNPVMKKAYRETLFEDKDTKSFVLNYDTDDSTLATKSIAVMLDNQQQDFKRADMIRSYTRNDTLYEERLAWITGKKFQIIQIATAGNTELTKQTYVYWRERK